MNEIGIDLVDVVRIRDLYERWGIRPLQMIFTDEELDLTKSRTQDFNWNSLAGRYALKEAVIKALPSNEILNLKDIEILKGKRKEPIINLKGKAAHSFPDVKWKCSISHDGNLAIAVAMNIGGFL
ncbi:MULTISPECIES: holo-ACP synthase [Bacillaceae]|uniref:holo-ACP synthase n=1 Tax=Bacillaceae TaxID=186817 RepID=UPI002079C0F9|nr:MULTISPECIES: holo-ACP synthase [Bacillaceae]MED3994635.1 holo-ACP synthase [Peribacillus frigoritolerans]USL11091.1 holo-ACP synthase [Bacillus bombysepticus]